MSWKRLLMAIALAAGTAEGAAAQAAGDASPRNVRDIFLALPFPDDGARALDRIGGRLSTRAGREAALRDAEIDLQNGWLRLAIPTEDNRMQPEVSLTYFNHAGGKRLVVLKVSDHGVDELAEMDYAWELEGSTFTSVDIMDYLPHLEYNDFWDDPRPNDLGKDFFLRMGAYSIQWPRVGTTAWFYVAAPEEYLGEPLPPELEELFDRRARIGVALLWNRREGRFTKGEYIDGDHEDHDHQHD